MELNYLKKFLVVSVFVTSSILSNDWVNDTIGFMRGGMRNFAAVGTVFPLSRYMASAMIDTIENSHAFASSEKIRIIEMGAGNGALTDYFVAWIEQQMHDSGKEFQLDLVELDSAFCDILKQKFKDYAWISVYCDDASMYKSDNKYDIMVSTLPFNSHFFATQDVAKILENSESLLRNHGMYMYVEYAACGAINKNLLLATDQKEIFNEKSELLAEFKKKHKAKSTLIFRNVPPTHLYSMHIVK